ncbi:uncharacterized protein LOC115450773 [Manduca sexta]|uniref:uncharacterized protein LOC115450773 n=1 Tax=Manduca sexta TaxID=7130 RepID=UPI0018901D9B|nr:uncharacterized protein LOC115450773 [Manduca sexta]
MDWSHERVLEFIELLEGEPCIWNPKSESHKNRNLVNDAWTRIISKLTVPCSIEELKKKRNTLLTQYRECLKKIKESTKTGSGADEIYRPSWFAFDAIHNFMGSVYDYRLTISTGTQESTDKSSHSNVYLVEQNLENEALLLIKNRCKEKDKEPDDCDLYGQLLAQKLKTLSVDDRLILMNHVDNIVFKYITEVRRRSSSVRTENMPSKNQTQLLGEHQLDTPGPSALAQPFKTSTPFETETQTSFNDNAHNSTMQIHLAEPHLPTKSSANSICVPKKNIKYYVASSSKNKYKRAKIIVNKKINIPSQQTLINPRKNNIKVQEANAICDDNDGDLNANND